MKNLKYLLGMVVLMVLSQTTWAFSLGFDSPNPAAIMSFIQGNNAFVYLSAFFGLGVLLAFTPCVLPMVPILSGIIVGQESLSTKRALKLTSAYVLGMAITYAVAGMLAGFMGSTVQTLMQRPSVIIVFSLIFVLMGVSMFGWFEFRLPAKLSAKLSNLSKKNSKRSFVSIGLMGVISTLVVSPCVTAPLIGVLTYIGQNGQILMGGVILFVMALGMGLPLLLVGAGYGSMLPKSGAWMIKIKQMFGLIMLVIAVWMLSRILSATITHLLWAVLFIGGSLSLGILQSQSDRAGRFFQLLGMIFLCLGGAFIYMTFFTTGSTKSDVVADQALFIKANTLNEITHQLELAKAQKKQVFIEFFATWCSDCQEMETDVFNRSDIAQAMQGRVNIKVDISDNSPEVSAIKKAFAIYGTPTMVFFDAKGQKLDKLTAVGYIKKDIMLKLFKAVY